MRRDVKPVAIAAETFSVAPHPRDRAADLPVHREQIAAGLIDIDEVEHDGMRAGAHQWFGDQRVGGRAADAPAAAVDEDVDRRTARRRGGGAVNVEHFMLAWAIGDALRCAKRSSGARACGGDPRQHEVAVRGVDQLIVGVVERLLIHVAPDQRTTRLCFFLHERFLRSPPPCGEGWGWGSRGSYTIIDACERPPDPPPYPPPQGGRNIIPDSVP